MYYTFSCNGTCTNRCFSSYRLSAAVTKSQTACTFQICQCSAEWRRSLRFQLIEGSCFFTLNKWDVWIDMELNFKSEWYCLDYRSTVYLFFGCVLLSYKHKPNFIVPVQNPFLRLLWLGQPSAVCCPHLLIKVLEYARTVMLFVFLNNKSLDFESWTYYRR